MPTPRSHGGAPLQYTPINVPGFRGLNKQAVGALLGPEWATRLENTVIDDNGRIAAREGWVSLTNTTPAAAAFLQLHEEQSTGHLFGSAEDNKLYRSTDDGDTWTDITNTATVTDPGGQFHDFNGVVLYIQSGQRPCVYSGVSFTDVADGSAPTGGASLAAFGRVWGATSTGKSVRYSALLDHTDWSGSDTGAIDLTSVWQQDDTITALAEFNGSLVIFGTRNIVIYTDGQGSALGVDPIQLYVVDTLNGIGCTARDSIAQIDGDIWFLSQSGLMSFGRLIQEKSNPVNNISRHVQDFLGVYQRGVAASVVRGVYSPKDRFYLLSFPAGSGSTETGVTFCFDTRGPAEDGSFRCAGVWNSFVPRAVVSRSGTSDLLVAARQSAGEVGLYGTYSDNGSSYVMDYESPWSDWGSPYLKVMKRLSGLFFVGGTVVVTFKWAFDFSDTFTTEAVTYEGAASPAEFGSGEFNIAEFNSGILLREKSAAGRKTGEHIKIGLTVSIDGAEMSIQQVSTYARTGRLR